MEEDKNNFDDYYSRYNSYDAVQAGSEEVEEKLWVKLEKTGRRINFIKDIFALYNYMRDKNVQWYRKSIVVAALIYFISPVDAIPDIAPLLGYLDDLGVITAVLKYLGHELIPYYDE